MDKELLEEGALGNERVSELSLELRFATLRIVVHSQMLYNKISAKKYNHFGEDSSPK